MLSNKLLYSNFKYSSIECYFSHIKNNKEAINIKDEKYASSRNFSEEIGILFLGVDDLYMLHEFSTPAKGVLSGIANKKDYTRILHSHNYFELIMVIDGEIEVQIENKFKTYKRGDCYILNRKIYHVENYTSNACVAFLCISEEFFNSFLNIHHLENTKSKLSFFLENINKIIFEGTTNNKIFWEFINNNDLIIDNIVENLLDIKNEIINNFSGYKYIIYGLLLRHFSYIIFTDDYTYNLNTIKTPIIESLAHETKHYIETYRHRLTRDVLETALHYNADYLNRIFKKEYGYTIGEYQRKICLAEAATLLLRTNKSIVDISELLGFSNRTQFYRLFHKFYNMTPLEYRNINKVLPVSHNNR